MHLATGQAVHIDIKRKIDMVVKDYALRIVHEMLGRKHLIERLHAEPVQAATAQACDLRQGHCALELMLQLPAIPAVRTMRSGPAQTYA